MEPNRDPHVNRSPSIVRGVRASHSRELSNGNSPRTESIRQRMAYQQHRTGATHDSPARQALGTPHDTPDRIRWTSSQSQQRSGLISLSKSNRRISDEQTSCPVHELSHSILPSVFRDGTTDVPRLRNVMSDLRVLQNMANGRHRFHLFLESEQGEFSSSTSERFKHVVTRVLFSPSVSMENMSNGNRFQALARVLNGISWDGTSDEALRIASNSSRRRHNIGNPHNVRADPGPLNQEGRPYHGDSRLNLDHNILREDVEGGQIDSREPLCSNVQFQSGMTLSVSRRPLPDSSVANWFACHRNDVEFPTWFPFEEKEYTFGPQTTGEPLYVRKEAVDNFEALETQQIHWIYRELFEFLFREAKRKKRRGLPSVFKYACFTPPWFRSQIIKGKQGDFANQSSVYFSNVVVPDMRNQRSRVGTTRLAYILGAFLQREPVMTRNAFIHLLRVVPVNPTLQKPQTRRRVGYMQPMQSNLPRSNATKRQRTANESAGDGRALPDSRTYNRTGTDREDGVTTPSRRTSLGDVEKADVNNRTDELRASSRKGASRQTVRQAARRIQDEPIDVDHEDDAQNSQTRNTRRRIEFETGTRSQIGERESATVGALSGQSRFLRRRIPPLFSSDNSDEESASNGALGGEISGSNHDEEEKEPFEDDE